MDELEQSGCLNVAGSLQIMLPGHALGFEAVMLRKAAVTAGPNEWIPVAIFYRVRGAIRFYDKYAEPGEVLIVREQGNQLSIHTFTYADDIQGRMEQISEAGGYQYGDHVKIMYQPGQLVALKVRGKPSKPL